MERSSIHLILMPAKINLVGKRYGKLIVIEEAARTRSPCGSTSINWKCHCDCGNDVVVSRGGLTSENSRSCGCYAIEVRKSNRKHGYAIRGKELPEYEIWKAMNKRCRNENDLSYRNYGGRGVAVCQRWIDSFESFLQDMGRRPSQDLSIERIDNNGNYEPSNCKWGTRTEQNNNKRKSFIVSVDGVKTTVQQVWKTYGKDSKVSFYTFRSRLYKRWSIEQALYNPLYAKKPNNI